MSFPKCTGNKHEFNKKIRKCIHCKMTRAQIRISDDISFIETILNSNTNQKTKDSILKPYYDKKPQYKGIYELRMKKDE